MAIIEKVGMLDSKTEEMRGTKQVKILNVIFPDSQYPTKITDWEQKAEFDEQIHFKSDGVKIKQNWNFKYSEEPSKTLNPNTSKPYTNRNLISITEVPKEVQKVQPPAVNSSNHGEIRTTTILERFDEIITRLQNLEKYLAESDLNDRLKRIEDIIAKDYTENMEKINGIIETLARIEKKTDIIAKKAGITEDAEFMKASTI